MAFLIIVFFLQCHLTVNFWWTTNAKQNYSKRCKSLMYQNKMSDLLTCRWALIGWNFVLKMHSLMICDTHDHSFSRLLSQNTCTVFRSPRLVRAFCEFTTVVSLSKNCQNWSDILDHFLVPRYELKLILWSLRTKVRWRPRALFSLSDFSFTRGPFWT